MLAGSSLNSWETFSSALSPVHRLSQFPLKMTGIFLHSVHGTKPGKYEDESQQANKDLVVVLRCSVTAPVLERGEV